MFHLETVGEIQTVYNDSTLLNEIFIVKSTYLIIAMRKKANYCFRLTLDRIQCDQLGDFNGQDTTREIFIVGVGEVVHDIGMSADYDRCQRSK